MNPYGVEKSSSGPVIWSQDWDGLPISIILPISILCLMIKQDFHEKRKQFIRMGAGPLSYEEQTPAKAFATLSERFSTQNILDFTRNLVHPQQRSLLSSTAIATKHYPSPSPLQQLTNQDRVFQMVSRWIENRINIIPYGAHVQEKRGVTVPVNIFVGSSSGPQTSQLQLTEPSSQQHILAGQENKRYRRKLVKKGSPEEKTSNSNPNSNANSQPNTPLLPSRKMSMESLLN
jgi:hypothetical protein